MQDIHLTGTTSTPAIDTDWTSGRVSLRGDSYPEDAFEFFDPLLTWINRYLAEIQAPLTLELSLLYINTSSIRMLMDLFDDMESAHQAGKAVSLAWHYDAENERVAELAEEFREDCSFPFSILKRAG
ncbi:biofilm regulation phosphoprotein SiaC [Laribacter hongkongensis]|uniref:biofilm regulation phosphoprotein SiaC n=1 Tax=Laribacter hongkongensis TaxID=168471 RepID=UPI001EFCA35C|nr:biofilm regulation phosphoprotein SiaC [Laribacter hongkongensis]MCG8996042.1 biofilm regulation phosphoprotein SiaC [Laribacter hongkongensis]MCG9011276.1 biofilm regulation phosphoprotein SiaC [Laribacter hongkongensis]MCG9023384.1 biofilm regulation phosphoprotein SiaC [Laribacter hongkongensis]MCG9047611.1 biofilm regulation phosphoprotein SiaC [Laribacter hongkongensis]MCG9074185.1 biofilm regulation phosphoprotein SiaC [Laribacter hongkongensis]